MPILGQFRITSITWQGTHALRVTIETEHTDRHIQLYAGRRLIGVTTTIGDLSVVGQLQPAHCPHAIMVVLVEAADRLTDFGADLPPRPYNQFDLAWSAAAFPADAKWFEITAATAADGAVDPDNIVARVKYIGDGDYAFLLPPINAPGNWPYTVTSRDDAEPQGNGTPANIDRDALPYPPDVLINDDDTRLAAVVEEGVLTVSFAYDWEE
jgi:hypothetical protein